MPSHDAHDTALVPRLQKAVHGFGDKMVVQRAGKGNLDVRTHHSAKAVAVIDHRIVARRKCLWLSRDIAIIELFGRVKPSGENVIVKVGDSWVNQTFFVHPMHQFDSRHTAEEKTIFEGVSSQQSIQMLNLPEVYAQEGIMDDVLIAVFEQFDGVFTALNADVVRFSFHNKQMKISGV